MDFTLEVPGIFPNGTTVKIYAASGVPDRTKAPTGAALQEKEVAEDKATFTELVDGASYYAGAEVSEGVWRYVHLSPGTPGVDPVASTESNETIAGDWGFEGKVGFHAVAPSAQGAKLSAAAGAVGEAYDAETKAALEAAITRIAELEARLVAKGLIAEA